MFRELPDGVSISVKVQPRSSRNSIVQTEESDFKAYLTAPPVDGAANQACVELLAKVLHMPKSSITILSGQKSRNKVFKIQGISLGKFLSAIQLNQRQKLTM